MEEKIAVAVIGREVYRTELKARTHQLIADEPIETGGKDIGPRPGDFLRMSLASCTAITLRMYANRKDYAVDEIQVTVSTEETEGKTIFNTQIDIKGNINEDEKERLMIIAKKCPVHKALTQPIVIHTALNVG